VKHLYPLTVALAAACGSTSPAPAPPVGPAPADPVRSKAELLAAEASAYEAAKPVFDRFCASCHQQGHTSATPSKLDHFDMTTYPFGGHHAMEMASEIREVLGLDGGTPTMPKNQPGAVTGDDLALIAAWADAFDAAHRGGAHDGHDSHGGGHHH
jgi:hypothetical protein